MDQVALLAEIGAEQKFPIVYVEIEELSKSGRWVVWTILQPYQGMVLEQLSEWDANKGPDPDPTWKSDPYRSYSGSGSDLKPQSIP